MQVPYYLFFIILKCMKRRNDGNRHEKLKNTKFSMYVTIMLLIKHQILNRLIWEYLAYIVLSLMHYIIRLVVPLLSILKHVLIRGMFPQYALALCQRSVNYIVQRRSWRCMVTYFCHHLSDDYVDLSDLYDDLSLIHLLENKS